MSIVKYVGKNSLAESLNKILEPQERRFNVKSEPDNHTWGVRMARIIEAAHEQAEWRGSTRIFESFDAEKRTIGEWIIVEP